MNTKFFVVGAIAAALVAGTAMAQTPTAATRAEINSASLNQAYKGQWRLYKMIGLDVYNQNDEKVGDISELLVDQTGHSQNLSINFVVSGARPAIEGDRLESAKCRYHSVSDGGQRESITPFCTELSVPLMHNTNFSNLRERT